MTRNERPHPRPERRIVSIKFSVHAAGAVRMRRSDRSKASAPIRISSRRAPTAGAGGNPLDGEPAGHDHTGASRHHRVARRLPRRAIAAVGHRVVHGGADSPVRCSSPRRLEKLRELVPLAPLHQPHNLAGIEASAPPSRRASGRLLRHLVPSRSQLRGRSLRDPLQLLRAGRPPLRLPRAVLRICRAPRSRGRADVPMARSSSPISATAPACARSRRRPVESTMGFTALDGLAMGTRSGQIDPGVLLHLMEHDG